MKFLTNDLKEFKIKESKENQGEKNTVKKESSVIIPLTVREV